MTHTGISSNVAVILPSDLAGGGHKLTMLDDFRVSQKAVGSLRSIANKKKGTVVLSTISMLHSESKINMVRH